MKLAVFVSDYRIAVDTLDKLKSDKLGIILVGNGVYHASVKEGGNASPLLKTSADFYALTEDLETRGIKTSDIDSSIKAINYGDLVDLIFDYEVFMPLVSRSSVSAYKSAEVLSRGDALPPSLTDA